MTHHDLKTRLTSSARDERGMALLIAVVLLLLMSALGVAALQHSGDESAGGGRSRRKDSTLYAAEAGQQLVQSRLYATWDSMASEGFTIDEAALVTDAFGNAIAVRSGSPGPAGLPDAAEKCDDTSSNMKSKAPTADGFTLNIGGLNKFGFRATRCDIVAQDTGNGLVHLQAQYAVLEK